jgi:hypothetical protein
VGRWLSIAVSVLLPPLCFRHDDETLGGIAVGLERPGQEVMGSEGAEGSIYYVDGGERVDVRVLPGEAIWDGQCASAWRAESSSPVRRPLCGERSRNTPDSMLSVARRRGGSEA